MPNVPYSTPSPRNVPRSTLHAPRGGFTLVEMIIAIGIFSTIVTIAVGGFVRALRTQRQAVGLLSANSNVSLVIEQMAREIRTGYDFCTNGQICIGNEELSFKNAKGETVTYHVQGGAIERNSGSGFQPLTAPNVMVGYLSFVLEGNEPTDELPPRITISMGVSSKEIGLSGTLVNLQTTVSARILDG